MKLKLLLSFGVTLVSQVVYSSSETKFETLSEVLVNAPYCFHRRYELGELEKCDFKDVDYIQVSHWGYLRIPNPPKLTYFAMTDADLTSFAKTISKDKFPNLKYILINLLDVSSELSKQILEIINSKNLSDLNIDTYKKS